MDFFNHNDPDNAVTHDSAPEPAVPATSQPEPAYPEGGATAAHSAGQSAASSDDSPPAQPEAQIQTQDTHTPTTEILEEAHGMAVPEEAEAGHSDDNPQIFSLEKSESMDFASALDAYSTPEPETLPGENRVIRGTVLKVTPAHVLIDIGQKSEGLIPVTEVTSHDGRVTVEAGDSIDVMTEGGMTEEGYIRLSHHKAQRLRAWDEIEHAYSEKTPISGTIVERTKGGLSIDIFGVRAFLPASQVDTHPPRNLEALKGQTMEVRVVKINKKRENVVVSHKQLQEEVAGEKRSQMLEQLHEGAVLTGVVKGLTDYGAFVDLGGVDGLLHITDMSWGRLIHPRDLVNAGDHIQVVVLKFDKEKQRVSLGFKQLTPDPWLDCAERYPVGAHVKGRVISVTDYGAFVELEQGIEGLVHVSEMSWSKRMKHPSKLVAVGAQVEAVVLSVSPADRRISLGLKQLETNPWESLHEKYPVGAVVEGRVRNLTDFGVFIEIEDGIDGLVHVSNLSASKRVKHPGDVLKKGERVRAKILAIEPEHRRLSLGMKQLEPDAWELFFQNHRAGDVVHGRVLRVASFGAFVELADGVEGLCHNSEAMDENSQPIKLEPGQEFDFKIIKMTAGEKKVGLSIRAAGEEASRTEVETYKRAGDGSSATLGELMTWKRGDR